jgi:VWFA-related protein
MKALADTGGRRVAMLFTDGEDTASANIGREVLERAKADDLMIYAVQIRSRAVPGVERQIIGPGPRTAPPKRGDPTPTQILRGLAGQSGGLHFMLNQNDDVNATFTQVAFELRHQYLLGFTPARLDGGIHELEVRTRNDRLIVRARRFYQAPRPPARGPEPAR